MFCSTLLLQIFYQFGFIPKHVIKTVRLLLILAAVSNNGLNSMEPTVVITNNTSVYKSFKVNSLFLLYWCSYDFG